MRSFYFSGINKDGTEIYLQQLAAGTKSPSYNSPPTVVTANECCDVSAFKQKYTKYSIYPNINTNINIELRARRYSNAHPFILGHLTPRKSLP
jgi:hypothetical protein